MKTKIMIFAVTIMFTSASAMADGYWHKLKVQAVALQELNDCKLVGEVVGSSGYGKTTKSIWRNKAKHKALKHAADLNATHVAWEDDSTGYGSGRFVSGKAFVCNDSNTIVKASAAK
jgi:hypothetical protein